jgi:hypothetical protein
MAEKLSLDEIIALGNKTDNWVCIQTYGEYGTYHGFLSRMKITITSRPKRCDFEYEISVSYDDTNVGWDSTEYLFENRLPYIFRLRYLYENAKTLAAQNAERASKAQKESALQSTRALLKE